MFTRAMNRRNRATLGLIGSAIAAPCLLVLVPSHVLSQELIECGFQPGETQTPTIDCAEDSALYVVKALFVTFPDVLQALGQEEQSLPQYADSMVSEIADYIGALSYGDAMLDFTIERRAGADSSYYWVAPSPSDSIGGNDIDNIMYSLPPSGWADNVDLVVFLQAARIPGQANPIYNANGPVCVPALHNIHLFTGLLQNRSWSAHSRPLIQSIVVHEMGHAFGAEHLPWGPGGNGTGCEGHYYSCFGMMQFYSPTSCADNFEPRYNGMIAYHPLTLVDIGFLHPDTIDYSVDDVVLGDVRSYKNAAVYIPLDPYIGPEHEGFLLTNHQLSKYDEALGERGLAVWHVSREPAADPFGCFYTNTGLLLDLEHPAGRWEAIDPGAYGDDVGYCRDLSSAPISDPSAGVDTLDCAPTGGGSIGALWAGVALSPSAYRSIDATTNPNSNRYPYEPVQKYRITPQVDTTGVAVRAIVSVADTSIPGKYRMKFDVYIDYP